MPTKPFLLQSLLLTILLLLHSTSVWSAALDHVNKDVFKDSKGNNVTVHTMKSSITTPVTQQTLYNAALSAFEIIRADQDENKKSTTVAALWVKDEKIVYFGGSAKGNGTDKGYIHPDVREALNECAGPDHLLHHKFNERCGEIVVISDYLRDKKVGRGVLSDSKKMIIAVQSDNKVKEPCRPISAKVNFEYGCKCFLKKMGFKKDEIVEKVPTTASTEVAERSGTGSHNQVEKRACGMKPTTTKPGSGKQIHKTSPQKNRTPPITKAASNKRVPKTSPQKQRKPAVTKAASNKRVPKTSPQKPRKPAITKAASVPKISPQKPRKPATTKAASVPKTSPQKQRTPATTKPNPPNSIKPHTPHPASVVKSVKSAPKQKPPQLTPSAGRRQKHRRNVHRASLNLGVTVESVDSANIVGLDRSEVHNSTRLLRQ